MLEPVVVSVVEYEDSLVVDGHRRVIAAKKAGVKVRYRVEYS